MGIATPEEILHPVSRTLFRHWAEIRKDRALPTRGDINLRQIRQIMPWLAIVERCGKQQGYHWRLAGTGICRLWGHELTGMDMTRHWRGFDRQTLLFLLDGVVGGFQPSVARFKATTDNADHIGIELLTLPVRSPNCELPQILATAAPFREPDWLGEATLVGFELSSVKALWPGAAAPNPPTERQALPIVNPQRDAKRAFLKVIPGGVE